MTCVAYDNCNHKDCDKSFCLRKYKLDTLYKKSQLSEAQRVHKTLNVDADGTDLDAFKKLDAIAKNIESFVHDGYNIYLHSNVCGNGKSSWGVRLIQSYLNAIWATADTSCHALFIDTPAFLLALKDNISNPSEYANTIKSYVYEADLIVWDDIAAKNASDFELNNLFSIIDRRIAMGKSNIYTTNCSTQEVYTYLGSRLASRICNYSIDIELKGKDKRNYATNSNLPDYLK